MLHKFFLTFLFCGIFCPICIGQESKPINSFIDKIQLSEKEKLWLEKNYVVRVHPDVWPPYNFWDSKTGSNQGICVEYLRWIAKQTGIRFEYPSMSLPLKYILTALENKQLDMSPSLQKTEERQTFLNFCKQPILESFSLFSLPHQKTINDLHSYKNIKISCEDGSRTLDFIKNYYPHVDIVPVSSEEDGLREVVSGEVDCHAGAYRVCTYLIEHYYGLEQLVAKGLLEEKQQGIYMAVRDDWPELVSIIDKAMAQMPNSKKQEILKSYEKKTDWNEYKNLILIILTALLLFLSLASYLLWLSAQKQKKQKQLLKSAKIAAESANKAKSTFLANMSHEIRTPLNVIVGMLDLTKNTQLSPKQHQYVTKSQNASKLLLNIINDILDYSKIEAQKIELNTCTFSLQKCIDDIMNLLNDFAKSKSLNFQSNSQQLSNYWIEADEVRLKQVLLNLLNNAIKFTNQGSVKLEIEVQKPNKPATNAPDVIQFTVLDTGIGIAKDKQKQLFDSFTQLDQTYIKKGQGTGLGLAISQKLVNLWGQEIHVNSTIGEGSKFWFHLPTKLKPKPENKNKNCSEQLTLSKDIKILLAEDNPMNREIAIELFTDIGIAIDCADNGIEALKKASVKNYDAILMDINMPVADGITACRLIKQKVSTQIPIIAVTAYAMADVRQQCHEAGMNAFISKPYTINGIIDVLKDVCPDHLFCHTGQSQKQIANSEDKEELINFSQGIIYANNNRERYVKQLQLFTQTTDQYISKIQDFSRKGTSDDLKSLIHNLKGEAAFLGLELIQTRCAEIHKHTNTEESEQLVRQLQKDLIATQSAILCKLSN